MKQQEFDFCDHHLDNGDKPRLTRQCRLILERLRQGTATNDELSQIARKYTGRVSDLRKSGWDIRCIRQNHKTGVSWYALFVNGEQVPS